MGLKLRPRLNEVSDEDIDFGLGFSSVPRLHEPKVWPEGNACILLSADLFRHVKIKGMFALKY